jgi:hypothetical protein
LVGVDLSDRSRAGAKLPIESAGRGQEVLMRRVLRIALAGAMGALAATAVAGGAVPAPAPAAPAAPPEPPKVEARAAFSSAKVGPVAIGVDADVYCSGWLGAEDEKFAGSVVSAAKIDTQSVFAPGDVVYIDIGKNRGAADGQEFWVCRPDVLVSKAGVPEVTIGRIYRTPSRIRITCAQENTSIAEIVAACEETEIGDGLLPFEPVPIPLVRRTKPVTQCDVPNGKAIGHIVHAFDRATGLSQHSIVFLDLGERDGVAPGDFLTVFRPRDAAGAVRTLLGEAAILTTKERSAVAKIVLSRDAIMVGDLVELK